MSSRDNQNRQSGGGGTVLSNIEATSRDEMICPHCSQYSIQEAPIASEYSNKQAKIIKGSECGNPNCDVKHIRPDFIRPQYKHVTITERIKQPKNILITLVVSVVTLIGIAYFLGVPVHEVIFATPEVTIDGTIQSPDGEPVQNARIELSESDYQAETGENGNYSLADVEIGTYTMIVNPPDTEETTMRPFAVDVEVTEEGIQSQNEYITENVFRADGLTLTLQSPQQETVSESLEVQDSQFTFTYLSEQNTESAVVEIDRIPDEELRSTEETTIDLGSTHTFDVQGEIVESELVGSGTVTTEEFSETQQSNDSGEVEFSTRGSVAPTDGVLTLSGGAITQSRSEEYDLQSGDTETVTASDEVVSDPTITIRGGNNDAPQQDTGSVASGDPIDFSISEDNAPSTVTLTLEGYLDTTNETVSGELGTNSEETISFTPEGSISPTDGQITIGSGDLQEEQIGTDSVQVSAENGPVKDSNSLGSVENDGGQYVLDYDFNKTQNPELVDGGYIINGEEVSLSEGTSQVQLNDVSQGDTIELWAEAQQESLERVSHPSSPLTVTNVDIQREELEVGEDTGLRATVENTSSGAVQDDVVAYLDGDEYDSKSVSLDSGETTQVTFPRASFDQEGQYAFQVNDSSVYTINVGGVEQAYGEGTIEGTLKYQSDQGEVGVDTNGNGSYDCTVVAGAGETCDVSLSSGTNEINVQQQNVSNVSYDVQYTARSSPQGIEVDMNNDGTNDIERTQPLLEGETVSETLTFPAGSHSITPTTENGEPVDYVLETTQSGVVASPSVTINGEVVIDESESFQGERSYTISNDIFTGGSNELEFQTEDDATHTVAVDWEEQGNDTAPEVINDSGSVVCTPSEIQSECSLGDSELTTGVNTYQLVRDGNAVEDVEVDLTYTGRDVPQTLTLQSTDSDTAFKFTETDAQETSFDGSWSHTRTEDIPTGETVELTTSTSSRMDLEGNVAVTYTAEREQPNRPEIVVENSSGSETFEVSEENLTDSGELESDATIEIPEDAFTRGQNTLTFTSENGGVYRVEIIGTQDRP